MTAYGASPVKRARRTADEIESLDTAIISAVLADAPVSLRGVYYRVVSAGAVDKTEAGYRAVGRRLLVLRRDGRVRYRDITDGTRYVIRRPSYDSISEALDATAATYRRSLWSSSPYAVEVFSEKDAISGVVEPVCRRWQVPLGIVRGYSSESFAWSVAQGIQLDKLTIVAQLGDHDPSGVGAWDDFTTKVRDFTDPGADIEFVRLAVTPEQIDSLDLPTRPTKKSDTRAGGWEGGSVEVDAIPAPTMRQILDDFISGYVDPHQLDTLRVAEESEKRILRTMAVTS